MVRAPRTNKAVTPILRRMGKFTGIRATSTASETDGKFRKEPVTEQVSEERDYDRGHDWGL